MRKKDTMQCFDCSITYQNTQGSDYNDFSVIKVKENRLQISTAPFCFFSSSSNEWMDGTQWGQNHSEIIFFKNVDLEKQKSNLAISKRI